MDIIHTHEKMKLRKHLEKYCTKKVILYTEKKEYKIRSKDKRRIGT